MNDITHRGAHAPPPWAVRKAADALLESIREETLIKSAPGQLTGIARELAASIVEAAQAEPSARFEDELYRSEFVAENRSRLKDIISSIPSAFHHYSVPGGPAGLFELPPAKYIAALETFQHESIDKLKKVYEVVWHHSSAMSEVRSGEKSQVHQENYLHPETGTIGYVAHLYLKEPDFASSILEWALVDAMIYARILDFANSRKHFGQLPTPAADQLIDGPLLPSNSIIPMGRGGKGISSAILQGIIRVFAYVAGEVVALVASWWLSTFITDTEDQKWLVFTALTSVRWVTYLLRDNTPSVRNKRLADERNLQMLWDLCLAHERVPDMNIGLLRYLLYRLEERGAALNPFVYGILDKRAKRCN